MRLQKNLAKDLVSRLGISQESNLYHEIELILGNIEIKI